MASSDPATTDVLSLIAAHPILIFAKQGCPYCAEAKRALIAEGYHPHEIIATAYASLFKKNNNF